MKTLILGAGIAGLSSAMVQQDQGDDVEILEAGNGVALETSFGNGGLMSPQLCEPFNQPGVSKLMIPALLGKKGSMLRIFPKALPSLICWGLKFLRSSTNQRFLQSAAGNYRLSAYSQNKTRQVINDNNFDIKFQNNGIMQVFRDQAMFDHCIAMHEQFAKEFDLQYEVLNKAEALIKEPHLEHSSDDLVGVIQYTDGARGECPLFCQQLADLLTSRGAKITTNVKVEKIIVENGCATGVQTSQGVIKADRIIVALGNNAPAILAKAGINLPVRPVKGYTISIPVDAELPKSVLLDIGLHMGIIPIHHNNTLRIGGGAEFAGLDNSFKKSYEDQAYATVEKAMPHLVPHLKRDQQKTWVGFRSSSFDGNPFIGPTKVNSLYVNSGLGHLGWIQGMGAASMLGDIIIGKQPEIDATPYRLDR
ncbi:FAD-dependent oxidoreductase [Thalassotalea psychrophila]|uniref:FAD-dependent oxidoreductase n=1 Tax=Thalassotalea psychrophila TaxID=3065647 RepID=A0ABY9TXX0_9GAMM|nr:FAD-dependent oxidoreductase [Colwelliaceae bacterium SQ149]